MLRAFGAKIGKQVHIYPTVKIAMPWNLEVGHFSAIGDHAIVYCLGQVFLGERVTISQYAHLCAGTHDYTDATLPLIKSPICIEDDAWICADAFVGPGITIGQAAVVGARSVAFKNVPKNTVVAGNPAVEKKKRNIVSS